MPYNMSDMAIGSNAYRTLQQNIGAAPYVSEASAAKEQAAIATAKLQQLTAQTESLDLTNKSAFEKQAADVMASIYNDPANKDKPESEKLAQAGALLMGSGNFALAKLGQSIENQSSLMQTREANAMKGKLEEASTRLDNVKNAIAAADTPDQAMVIITEASKDPANAMRFAPIAKKIIAGAPMEEVRKDLMNIHASYTERVNYEKFKLLQAEERRKADADAQRERNALRDDANKRMGIESREKISGIISALKFVQTARDSGLPVSAAMLRKAGADQATIDYIKEANLMTAGKGTDQAPSALDTPKDNVRSLAERNNNPLNLMNKSGELQKFDTYDQGKNAATQDLANKLEGNSPAYKARFGDKPVTPSRLAETWAPAGAKGNSAESTLNYSKAIASALGISPNDTIDNTRSNRVKLFDAMAQFESGTGGGDPASATGEKAAIAGQPKEGDGWNGAIVLPPKAGKAGGMASAISQRLAWGITEGAMQAKVDILNIADMPSSSAYNALAGLTAKSGASYIDAVKAVTARQSTPEEDRVFEQLVSGFETNMARAMGGGYASSSTRVIMENYHQQVSVAGDSPIVKAAFLARIKQELAVLAENFKSHPGANPAEIELFRKMNVEIDEKIKFNVSDVTSALNYMSEGPMRTQAQAGFAIVDSAKDNRAKREAAKAEKAAKAAGKPAAKPSTAPAPYADPAEEAAYQQWLKMQGGK